jgi:hypothetical protein
VPQGVEDHDNGAGIRLLADLGDHSQVRSGSPLNLARWYQSR